MGQITIQGDNSPTGILRHWERKTKAECAREILRCWEERDQLLQKIDDLEAARAQCEPIGFIEQDEIDSLRDGCSFAAIRKEEDRQDMTAVYAWPRPTGAQIPQSKAIVDRVIGELESGFVACKRCGDQEDTATLDCMSDLRKVQALLSNSPGNGKRDKDENKSLMWPLEEDACEALRDFIGNEQYASEVTLSVGWIMDEDGKDKHYGLRCCLSEYPEEGSILLYEMEPPREQEGHGDE